MSLPDMISSALPAAGSWFAGLGQTALDAVTAVGTWLAGLPSMVLGWLASLGSMIATGTG
ncbi:hypothetical protein ATL51_0084 [Pseudonocardia alni]|uniref:Uncharacterized protein n=1 Tax=Pseudonocardia alni TaxID=33907 RepID=A0AA44UVN1_PSEA5|nr:hypothetical protein ATL51_0084 [Pseudonocardia alni]